MPAAAAALLAAMLRCVLAAPVLLLRWIWQLLEGGVGLSQVLQGRLEAAAAGSAVGCCQIRLLLVLLVVLLCS